MSPKLCFIEELKRRNVFRVGIAYAVVSWLIIQVVGVALDSFGSPPWVMKTILVVLAAGLPFALIFAWAFELTPEGLKKEKDVDRTQSITHVTGRKLDFAIIGILVVALGYFAYDKFVLKGSEPFSSAEGVAAEGEAGKRALTPLKSIAVLPFVNMSSDPEQEFFSDGISEEILNSLSKVKELQVAGRTSSFAFKGKNQDLRLIGETLGVGNILEGSVRKSGDTVRITAQLIRVDNGFHLWSETYDRKLDNVFAIQDEIATAILKELKATLLAGEDTAVKAVRTDTKAYDLYLLAKQRLYERTGPTIESAAELLDRAIAIDPEYAPAYAQRGIAALLLSKGSGTYGEIPRDQSLAQGKLYLDKALQLDPELAEAWAGMGLYYMNLPKSDLAKGTEALQKALAINPGMIDASNWLHNILEASGKVSEANALVMDMIQRDPLYRPGIRNGVESFVLFGQQDQALAYLERIRPLIPNDAVIQSSEAAIRLSLGQTAEGVKLIESAVALQPTNSVARLTRSFAWMDTHQYERVAAEGEAWMPIFALKYLGRTEEASMLAFKWAEEQADPGILFSFLNNSGRSDEVVAYLEERWPDLDALRKDFPPYSGLGDFLMLDVALAYSRTGNQQRFDDAMQRVKTVHDGLKAQGVSNTVFWMSEAAYQALAGNLDSCLEYLDRAVKAGAVTATRMATDYPMLAPLEGDPRFEAIQARMIEHLNSERQKLGLEPVSI